MISDLVKIAIIGCGRVANHYKKIFKTGELKDYKLVGFCDIDKKKSSDFAKFFNVNSYREYNLMLQVEKPDLVIILTPSGLHYKHTKIAFEHGCHVLCEKPISMLPNQAEDLKMIAEEKKLMYVIAFQNRLNPAVIALRKAIRDKKFGKIITATIRLRWCRFQEYYDDGWHGTWAHDGGVINQQAIHHVDAINWLLGPIECVNATIANQLNELEAEDTLVAIMKFKNKAIGTIEATTAARPEDFEASISVVGEKGMVEVGGIALNKIISWNFIDPNDDDKEIPKKFSQDVDSGYGKSHGPLLQGIISNLKDGKIISLVPAEDAIYTTKIVHALYKSDEVQKWVYLKDNPVSERLGR